MHRRRFLSLAGIAALAGCARGPIVSLALPSAPSGPLSDKARALIERAWTGIDPARVLDVHAHLIGLGTNGSGAYVNESMRGGILSPFDAEVFEIYTQAGGVTDLAKADQQYLETLVQRVREQPRHGRLLLLAFDQAYHEDGTVFREASEFYTPNDYALQLAKAYPDCFVAAGSVHPYRADAVDELERIAALGAVAIKWLPNAMRIDPASPKCDPFYDALARLGLPIVSHAGEERAVKADDAQRLGNPLRLRRALDRGVKVIVAHCASLGEGEDLDAAGEAKPLVTNLSLFLRLMGQKEYVGRLFGDVSAMLQFNRAEALASILARTDLHERLVYGTDYPLPAISAINRTGKLRSLGYIGEEEEVLLDEILRHNPLLFDFVAKRTLRLVSGGRTYKFPPSVFAIRPELFPRLAERAVEQASAGRALGTGRG